MKPQDLIATARDLLASGKSGKPRQANLRRATSTAYYAMFHGLARSNADLLIGSSSSRSEPAWRQTYRALEHSYAKAQCQNGKVIAKFPRSIQDFANVFVQMQDKRHQADYEPTARLYKSAVKNDIATVEVALSGFDAAPVSDRRAFAAFVLFKLRP